MLQWRPTVAKIKKPRKDNQLCQQGQQDAWYFQEEVSPLDGKVTVTQQFYGMKVMTILNASERLTSDFEYLSALVENPDPEFHIKDALVYAEALMAVAAQLDYVVENLSQNELSEDEEYVKLTKDEVMMLNTYNTNTEEALLALEQVCGISLKNN